MSRKISIPPCNKNWDRIFEKISKIHRRYYLQQVEIGDHAKSSNWDRIFEEDLKNSIKYSQKFEFNFRKSPDHPKFKVNFIVSIIARMEWTQIQVASHPPRYSGTFIEPSTSLQWKIHRAIHLVTVEIHRAIHLVIVDNHRAIHLVTVDKFMHSGSCI